MAQQIIDLGTLGGADGTGDSIRTAGVKINSNFAELYANPLASTQLGFLENEISSTQSNADIVLKPSGTGSIVFPAIRFNDNNIEGTRTNEDIKFVPNGNGQLTIDGIGFRGTSIGSTDSSIVNINENLTIGGDLTTTAHVTIIGTVNGVSGSQMGTLTLADGSITDSSGAISFGDENITSTGTVTAATGSSIGNLTLANGSITDSSGAISFSDENLITTGNLDAGATTLSTLTVSGATSFVGTTTVDNLTFNDNIISTSSNADLVLTPGGTGIVNVSNLTIDSGINFTDNIIKVIRSNDNLVLSPSGIGSVHISKVDINGGTVDGTVVGGTTPAAGYFHSLSLSATSLTADGVTMTDNTVKANASDSDLEISPSGTGNVVINDFTFPNTVIGGQFVKTDGSKTLSLGTFSILYVESDLQDATATVLGSSSSAQVVDTWSASTYRSVKYHLQISDSTADRYRIIDANVTHDGSTAYISVFGGVDNGDGDGSSVYDSMDFTADISGGNVRLLGTVNNTNNQVIKLVKRMIKV